MSQRKVVVLTMLIASLCFFTCGCNVQGNDPMIQQLDTPLYASDIREEDSPEWIKELPDAKDSDVRELIVVAGMGMDKTTATFSMHKRDESGNWKQILSSPGYVGKNGMCLEKDYVEGGEKTPIGTYYIKRPFGNAINPKCDMAYTRAIGVTYFSADPEPDMRYNELVNLKQYPDLDVDKSIRLYDHEYEYQYCVHLSFNEDNDPDKGYGVFLHCLNEERPYTDKGVAIPEYIMRHVIRNLTKDTVIIIDTLDNLGGKL